VSRSSTPRRVLVQGRTTRVFEPEANYAGKADWHLALGFVEGRPAVLVDDPGKPGGAPSYFVLLGWTGNQLVHLRDFRYARYVMDGAEVRRL
jgi:RNA polymerase sigma-70 factor, ECF subfamily